MKGTAHALFTGATRHRMCYEIICDHIHNSADHVYNRGNHMYNIVLQTEETQVIITKAAENLCTKTHEQLNLYIFPLT